MKIDPRDVRIQFEPDGASWNFTMSWRSASVGYLWATLSKGALRLDDFKIYDDVLVPRPFANRLLLHFGVPIKSRNFRELGLGALFLDRFLKEADFYNVSTVWGSVPAGYPERTPYLLDFYQSRGFDLFPPDEDCLENAVYKIVRKRPKPAYAQ